MPGDRRRTIDIAFPAAMVAIFVDGCFWHGCPLHATWPKRNGRFWEDKILCNMRRDQDTDARLTAAGWRVVRIWEHEALEIGVQRIARELHNRG